MILFFLLSALIWGVGWKLKAPANARWMLIGLLYVVMLLLLVLLPAGNPLDRAFGGSVGNWLVVGAIAGLVYAYFWGLKSCAVSSVRKIELPKTAAKAMGRFPTAR